MRLKTDINCIFILLAGFNPDAIIPFTFYILEILDATLPISDYINIEV